MKQTRKKLQHKKQTNKQAATLNTQQTVTTYVYKYIRLQVSDTQRSVLFYNLLKFLFLNSNDYNPWKMILGW